MGTGNIVPIKDGFENPRAFLMHIATDDNIESACVVVVLKDGTMLPAHIKFNRSDLAFAGALLTKMALDGRDD